MGIPLYVIFCFSLAAFNIFCLYLIFDSLINMCLGVFLLGFILCGTLCFLDLIDYFLSHIREVFKGPHFKCHFLTIFFLSSPCLPSRLGWLPSGLPFPGIHSFSSSAHYYKFWSKVYCPHKIVNSLRTGTVLALFMCIPSAY